MSTQGFQFGRSVSLVVAGQGHGIDLSELHFRFSVRASDQESPNTAEIRVYNAKSETVNQVISEFTTVLFQVGYGGQLATLFQGTIKQFKKGKESNTDTFLDILAADGDELYNFGFINTNVAAGSTYKQRFDSICTALGAPQDPNAQGYMGATGGVLPRGKVLFGLGRTYLRDLAKGVGCRWSIQNGAITMIPLNGYLPGTPIDIDGTSGMIGIPEATDQGVEVTVLLNPLIIVGQAVTINASDITQTTIREQGYPNYGAIDYVASVQPGKGTYRVMVAEHEGDTRENNWYTRLTCLAIDLSSNSSSSVLAYGGPADTSNNTDDGDDSGSAGA